MDELKDEITRVARDMWIRSGFIEGHDLDFWLEAEKLVKTWHEPFEERERHVGASEMSPQQQQALLQPGSDEVVH